jgi:hypothetical protein
VFDACLNSALACQRQGRAPAQTSPTDLSNRISVSAVEAPDAPHISRAGEALLACVPEVLLPEAALQFGNSLLCPASLSVKNA